MEKNFVKHMTSFLMENYILPFEQHGFLSGRSITRNLLYCLNVWTFDLGQNHSTDIIYLDFAKVFDKVNILYLTRKLENVGISENLLNWIKSFWQGRIFQVKVGTGYSDNQRVLTGIPQESVLGLLLFLVFITELPRILCN